MKVALFGAEGKVGAVLGAALAAEGHEVAPIEEGDEVAIAGNDAAVDFTQPDAGARNVQAARHPGAPPAGPRARWRARPGPRRRSSTGSPPPPPTAASPCSARRTPASARC